MKGFPILDKVEKLLVRIGNATLVLFFAMTFYQVIGRFFGFNTVYTEEIANYSFIWMAFIGSSICTRSGEHFSFNAFTEKLSGKAKRINLLIVQLILLVFNCVVAYYGVILTMKFWSWRFSSLPFISLGLAWLCIPIYGFTVVLYNLEQIYKLIKFGVSTDSKTNEDTMSEVAG